MSIEPFSAITAVLAASASGFHLARARRRSVASITAGLRKTVAHLDRHAKRKLAEVAKRKVAIQRHVDLADAANVEAELAQTVRSNIGSILGETK